MVPFAGHSSGRATGTPHRFRSLAKLDTRPLCAGFSGAGTMRPFRGKVDVYYPNGPTKAALSQPVPPSPKRFHLAKELTAIGNNSGPSVLIVIAKQEIKKQENGARHNIPGRSAVDAQGVAYCSFSWCAPTSGTASVPDSLQS
jgi:hypothetical protein